MKPASAARKVRSLSLRWQLLIAVNSVCAVFLIGFLAFDYHREFDHRLRDKRVALQEEAATLLEGVRAIQHHGDKALQSYIDKVCGRMEEPRSPGHHIAVQFGDFVLQAHAHQRASDDFFKALQAAERLPDQHASFQGRPLIVGTVQDAPLQVYVSEYLDEVQEEVASDVIRRFAGAVLLAVLAGGIINVLLLRLVARPLDRLVAIVDLIGSEGGGETVDGFQSSELISLSTAINRMSDSLADADRQRARQMEKARQIQEHLHPKKTEIPEVNVAVLYEPAEHIAGDYYDILPLADQSWVICLADVAGHGIPAAMSATLLKAFLLDATERHAQLLEILTRINQRFTETTLPEHFATVILIHVLPQARKIQYVNAGHPAGLHFSKSPPPTPLDSSGMLIGIDPSETWIVQELDLAPGDRLVLFTDGVVESFNAQGEQFGEQRLLEQLAACQHESTQTAVKNIRERLHHFRSGKPAADDVTLLVFDF